MHGTDRVGIIFLPAPIGDICRSIVYANALALPRPYLERRQDLVEQADAIRNPQSPRRPVQVKLAQIVGAQVMVDKVAEIRALGPGPAHDSASMR
jgi:hypothetical protein